MFGGMMNPDMMRLAQEQMSRMRPEDLQRMQQQMMSNPDLLRMASEGMKNMRPEDLRMAAERMKDIPADQIADMSSRMANASPEEIASMRAQSDAQRSYEYQGALSLKTQGNQLHNVGKYSEAAEKYLRAKNNLTEHLTAEAKKLQLTCSLNLMSCYLKTKQYKEVIAEGTEVLAGDSGNLKALYRRGQAYKELKQFKLSVSDLKNAAAISPDDETIAEMLRQAREELEAESGEEEEEESSKGGAITDGPIIEEISDEEAEKLSSRLRDSTAESSSNGSSVVTDDGGQSSAREGTPPMPNGSAMGENLRPFLQNPEMMRSMQEMMSSMDPEHVAAMTGGGMTPEMAKMAADMMKSMSPEALEKMMGMASQFQSAGGATPFQAPPARPDAVRQPVRQSSAPAATTTSAATTNRSTSGTGLESESSSSSSISPSPRQNTGEGMPSMANFSPEMQEQLRKQMNDPAMKQMMASMVKNLTPEAMTSMSESMGMKLSPEDAAQAQKVISNMSPDDLDRLMVWADRAQRVVAQAKQVKNWVLGRAGLVLALAMLILAVILHRLGYIG